MSDLPVALREVDRLPYVKVVIDRLKTIGPDIGGPAPYVAVFVSEATTVPTHPRTGLVQRYVVLHPFFGAPGREQDLGESTRAVDWLFQVTCWSFDPLDCFSLARDTDQALHRWTPAVDGYEAGLLHPPSGYDPGPPRRDPETTRWHLPLQYRTDISRHH